MLENVDDFSRVHLVLELSVKDFERVTIGVLRLRVPHATRHQDNKLFKVNHAVAVLVNRIDHRHDFLLANFRTHGLHHSAQFILVHGAVVIPVEQLESLFKLLDVLAVQQPNVQLVSFNAHHVNNKFK